MKIEFKIVIADDEASIKQEQVIGVRRSPIVHLALTPEEANHVRVEMDNILFRINARRNMLTEEERAELPQIVSAKKEKTEIKE